MWKEENILPEECPDSKNKKIIFSLGKGINSFSKIISIIKTDKMDLEICENLYIFRIKSILEKNKKKKNKMVQNIFNSSYPNNCDVEVIAHKIFELFNVDGQIIMLSMFILDKFLYKSKIVLNEMNLIKIMTISLIETIKFHVDDHDIEAKTICFLLQIDQETLVNLEFTFLSQIDFMLKVDEEKFNIYKKKIIISGIDYLKILL